MAADFYIKVDDTRPALRAQLLDEDNDPIDLTGATVTFKMRAAGVEDYQVDAAADVVSAAEGIVEYVWQAEDTDTAGRFNAEFIISDGGDQQTVPNSNAIEVQVVAHV